jgi:hypothetical protein
MITEDTTSTLQTSTARIVNSFPTPDAAFVPSLLVIDYETALLDGIPSVEAYRDDFRATSAAFAWRDKDGYLMLMCKWGEDDIRDALIQIRDCGAKLIAHNLQFELMATKCRFPGMEDLIQIDTMRLAQMSDNGGDCESEDDITFEDELLEVEGKKPFDGLSLEACVSRFLKGRDYRHKKPYLDLIVSRGGVKGDFHLLTQEELTEYNLKDAEVTMYLYEALIDLLGSRGIDWSRDHVLYRSRCDLVSQSEIEGIMIDVGQVDSHIEFETKNLQEIEVAFREAYKDQIASIEARKAEAYVSKYRSEDGRLKALARISEGLEPKVMFNLASRKDKTAFFIEELGMDPRFFTKKGNPTFGSKFLWQYGEAGLSMSGIGRTRLSKKQAESLKKLSSRDGRWHHKVRCASTRNGRLSGGG